jgi:hypothetical protein
LQYYYCRPIRYCHGRNLSRSRGNYFGVRDLPPIPSQGSSLPQWLAAIEFTLGFFSQDQLPIPNKFSSMELSQYLVEEGGGNMLIVLDALEGWNPQYSITFNSTGQVQNNVTDPPPRPHHSRLSHRGRVLTGLPCGDNILAETSKRWYLRPLPRRC